MSHQSSQEGALNVFLKGQYFAHTQSCAHTHTHTSLVGGEYEVHISCLPQKEKHLEEGGSFNRKIQRGRQAFKFPNCGSNEIQSLPLVELK